jgi:hypothetical protein
MGKVLYRVGGVINWLAYVWLVTSEALEEVFYGTIGDSVRGIFSEVEVRQHAPKVERRTLSRQDTTAKVADTL